ncbi:hypothetical protein QEH42_gp198 [Microbacterium phage Pumpernickel]|uniref:Uncharacterized protein n=1 Tax=Microbacterium phage Pumpernickel TaxID=2885983 RepID=A0AAE8Y7C5_9CAUD|nr:hypothetical protein QEH42_gp198 [Microbacterium phage Pumpernickel]UDL16020.1 hypothetical protein SEA_PUMPERNICKEL_270 [Microbacterium phage Pumpernickel]
MAKKPISLSKTAELRKLTIAARKRGIAVVNIEVDVVDALIDLAVSEPWTFKELLKAKIKRRRQRKALEELMAIDHDWEER